MPRGSAGLRASLSGFVLLALGSGGIARAAVPSGFVDELVASVGAPTDVAFTPDGRMLVTSQGGPLLIYAPPYSTGTVALTFPAGRLCSNSERGLLGVAVDPAFASNGHVYLFYTFQKSGTTGCPTGNTNVVNRVSRFTFSPPSANTISLATELVLIDNIPSPNGNHNAGDLAFGKDGYLYVTTGEGGVSSAARDESFLGGKILRIDPRGATPGARIPPTNPFQGPEAESCAVAGRTTTAGKTRCQETFAWGLRNPFRFAFDPGAVLTRFHINDVGQNTWEEIDLGQAGADYGWNVREGFCANSSATDCGPPPAGMTNPVFAYQHSVQVPGTTSPSNCNSITGGAFVPAGSWPTAYDRSYLFADYVCGWIFQRLPGGAVGDFATNLGGGSATSLQFGPSGSTQALYYTTYGAGGQVRRVRYTGTGNRAPLAVATANPATGSAPLNVTFDASGSSDPDGNLPLVYQWNFGDNSPEVRTSSPTVSHLYGVGTFTAFLRVEDSLSALSDPASIVINAGNSAPLPFFLSPASSLRFRVGQALTLSGGATDLEDVNVPASGLSWTVLLHHNDHTHPYLGPVSGNDIPLTAPAPEDLAATANSYLEIRLTATDSLGARTTISMDLLPNRVNVSFATAPVGLRVTVNGTTVVGPQTVVSWEAWALNVSASPQVDGSGNGYAFVSWSDGGAPSHTITTPATPATYTATFTPSPVLLVSDAAAATQVPNGMDAVFTVRLSNASSQTVQVGFTTANGTAAAGTDYTFQSGTLSFTPGALTRTITVPVGSDPVPGPNRSFFVNLSSPSNAAIADGQGVGTIVKGPLPVDFNTDGRPDLLWLRQGTGDLAMWFMEGTVHTGGVAPTPGRVDPSWVVAAVADLNGDNEPDIVWQRPASGDLVAWHMDGATRVSGVALTPSRVADPSWRIVGAADFNGDRKPDLLWQRPATGDLVVWFMDGAVRTSGVALTPSRLVNPSWDVVGVADFNRDGHPDILWRHRVTGDLAVWFMDGTTRTTGAALSPGRIDPNWRTAGVADVDGDGKPDVLWQHRVSGDLVVWFMDGTTMTSGRALAPSRVSNVNWEIVAP